MIINLKSCNKGSIITLVAAIIAAMLSSVCCIGPLVYLAFGISAAAFSGFTQLTWLQIPMLVISVGLMLSGFWRLYFSKKPFCTAKLSRKQTVCLYWLAVPIILIFQLYPFVLPWIVELFE